MTYKTNETAALCHPGERVITRAGDVVTIAYVTDDGRVFAWRTGRSVPILVCPRGDAYGGEHDMALGMVA